MSDESLAGRRVLLVEDETMVAMLAEDLLTERGCSVVATASVAATLGLLAADRRFDAAVVDVSLQGENSFAVADALAAQGIPFVFATGYGTAILPAAHQARPVLSKPYRERALVEAVQGLLVA